MPGGSIPIPEDVLSLVGDYQGALKVLEHNIKQVDREIAQTLRKEGDITALIERKEYLMNQRTNVGTQAQEQAMERRFNSYLERRSARIKAENRYTVGDMRDAKDVWDLAHGEFTHRNAKGAMEIVSKVRRTGIAAAASGMVDAAVNTMAAIGPEAVATLPFVMMGWMQDAFKEAESNQAKYNQRISAIDNAFKGTGADPSRTYSMVRRMARQNEDTWNTNDWSDVTKRIGTINDNPAVAAAIIKFLQPDAQVLPTQASVAEYFLTKSEFDQEGATGMQLNVVDMLTRKHEREEKNQRYFSSNAADAAKFHEQQRNAQYIERERYQRSVRAW